MRGSALRGQTVVVIGGSSGIGLETARLARAEGADLILTARNADRLSDAGRELGAKIAAFDVTDFDRLQRFFEELPGPVDLGDLRVLAREQSVGHHPGPRVGIELIRRMTSACFLTVSTMGVA